MRPRKLKVEEAWRAALVSMIQGVGAANMQGLKLTLCTDTHSEYTWLWSTTAMRAQAPVRALSRAILPALAMKQVYGALEVY
ncbi:MAG: hypothetical protein ABI670_08845 [Chloroflexota bacterium]